MLRPLIWRVSPPMSSLYLVLGCMLKQRMDRPVDQCYDRSSLTSPTHSPFLEHFLAPQQDLNQMHLDRHLHCFLANPMHRTLPWYVFRVRTCWNFVNTRMFHRWHMPDPGHSLVSASPSPPSCLVQPFDYPWYGMMPLMHHPSHRVEHHWSATSLMHSTLFWHVCRLRQRPQKDQAPLTSDYTPMPPWHRPYAQQWHHCDATNPRHWPSRWNSHRTELDWDHPRIATKVRWHHHIRQSPPHHPYVTSSRHPPCLWRDVLRPSMVPNWHHHPHETPLLSYHLA